ncbi:hypothetical protein NQU17_07050 [Clostridiaceae bacterium HFYG-1003]|nr:hypothetical protein NQU17_07050 [Clostridiaceae bacterium HFYG-1003]
MRKSSTQTGKMQDSQFFHPTEEPIFRPMFAFPPWECHGFRWTNYETSMPSDSGRHLSDSGDPGTTGIHMIADGMQT